MRIAIATTIKINFLLFNNGKDFFLNVEDPHREHTILPPKDRSETIVEHPQFKQTLFTLI